MKYEPVVYMPPQLEPNVLYVSSEYETAIHLCACGCGMQTVTPFGQGWVVTEVSGKPTISPSILNPCGSHYFVRNGEIVWA